MWLTGKGRLSGIEMALSRRYYCLRQTRLQVLLPCAPTPKVPANPLFSSAAMAFNLFIAQPYLVVTSLGQAVRRVCRARENRPPSFVQRAVVNHRCAQRQDQPRGAPDDHAATLH